MPTRNTDDQSRAARPMKLRYRVTGNMYSYNTEIRGQHENDRLRTWRPNLFLSAHRFGRQKLLGGPFAEAWTSNGCTYVITAASAAQTRCELQSLRTTSLPGGLPLQDGDSIAQDQATPSSTQQAWSLAAQCDQAGRTITTLHEIASPSAELGDPLAQFSGAAPRFTHPSRPALGLCARSNEASTSCGIPSPQAR